MGLKVGSTLLVAHSSETHLEKIIKANSAGLGLVGVLGYFSWWTCWAWWACRSWLTCSTKSSIKEADELPAAPKDGLDGRAGVENKDQTPDEFRAAPKGGL